MSVRGSVQGSRSLTNVVRDSADASTGQFNNAAVSYACAVGKGLKTGTSTLETTKQWCAFPRSLALPARTDLPSQVAPRPRRLLGLVLLRRTFLWLG